MGFIDINFDVICRFYKIYQIKDIYCYKFCDIFIFFNFIENYIQVEQDGFNLGGFSFGFVKIFEECEQYYFKGKYGVVQDEIDDKIVEVD